MTPTRRKPEPWWHAHTGLLVTLALTATGGFVMVKSQLAALEAKASATDSLERRIAALEALCREK
jgi:hypothetical protein